MLATLTSKGQITIPKPIRDHLGLNAGDRLDFIVTADGRVELRPKTTDTLALAGMIRPGKGRKAPTIEAIDAAIGQGAVEGVLATPC